MFEDLSVSKVKGVGKKTEEALQNLGVYSVGDMLSYFPRDYVELPEPGFSPEKARGTGYTCAAPPYRKE